MMVGGPGGGSAFMRLAGFTINIKTAPATSKKFIIVLRKRPMFQVGAPAAFAAARDSKAFPERLTKRLEKSTPPSK